MPSTSSLDSNLAPKAAGPEPLVWHDPASPPFRLAGFAWYETDRRFRRLPLSSFDVLEKINPRLNALANQTAGGQLRFYTDSTALSLRVELSSAAGLSCMTPAGQSGFDLYLGMDGQPLRMEAVTTFPYQASSYEAVLFEGYDRREKDILLHFPLYNGVRRLEIGLSPGARLAAPAPFATDRPLVFYGTSITQGGCASRPGMAYPNILSRRMNVRTLNLGFSGNAFGEPELADILGQIENPSGIVVDFEANGGWNGKLEQNLYAFLERLRQTHRDTPLLVVSRLPYQPETHNPSALLRREELRAFQRNAVEEFRQNGDSHITFLDGRTLLGEDFAECYVDAVHPTDLGFWKMADGLEPILRAMLTENLC